MKIDIKKIFPKALQINRALISKNFRPLLILTIVGIIVGIFWCFNSTLVYDDIAFPANFSGLINNIGWVRSLIKIFVLDLPNEYRTYGLSRVIQFILWTIGGASSTTYTIIISLSQIATALTLYALLVSTRIEKLVALSAGLTWLLSPFIWTSCFHHYSYLILPIQITLIGSYFLITATTKRLGLWAVLLGMAIALTGELHIMVAIFILIIIAWYSGKKPVIRASFITISSILSTIIGHYSIWKTFAANSAQPQRFSVSFFHNTDFWTHRLFVATRGINRSVLEQLTDIAGNNISWLIEVTAISSLLTFFLFAWTMKQTEETAPQKDTPRYSLFKLAGVLIVSASLYLAFFVIVVVVSDSVPSSMPRRYGYISLTTLLLALLVLLSALWSKRKHRMIALSILMGVLITLFIRHQTILIPTTRSADNKLSERIGRAIEKNPTKIVLFFSSSEKEFPLASIGANTLGPAPTDFTNAEVTQAKYGTYWPAYINITKVLGAPYTCEMGNVQSDNKIKLICPTWQKNPGFINSTDAIIVANLGFDEFDPFGKNVKVFESFKEFEPYFFAKKIIRDISWKEPSPGETLAIDLGTISPESLTDDVLPDKNFTDPLPINSKNWLTNYGLVAGEDRIYKFPNISINSEYYRTNRNGSFEYAFDFLESDVDIDLDFWELWKRKSKERVFSVQVSWNNGKWTPLGTVDMKSINGNKPFSIRLSHQNTNSFRFRLSPTPGTKDVPFIQGVRIIKR